MGEQNNKRLKPTTQEEAEEMGTDTDGPLAASAAVLVLLPFLPILAVDSTTYSFSFYF